MLNRAGAIAAGIVLLLSSLPGLGAAGVITERATFENLVENPVMDNFEGFFVTNGGAEFTSITTMDHTTMIGAEGPDLVNPGATYNFLRSPLCWLGDMYEGYPMTKTIIAWNGATEPLESPSTANTPQDPTLSFSVHIKYDTPPQLIGVDLLRWGELGLVTFEVYDQWGGLIEIIDVDVPVAGVPSFVGYRYDDGIGDVVIKNTRFPAYWSPSIDNHCYGALDTTPTASTTWGQVKKRYR